MDESVLVTGANGEIGHGLIPELAKAGANIIALDVKNLDDVLKPHVKKAIAADILDSKTIASLVNTNNITSVYHLAAILSTGAEKDPERAHSVNVGGTSSLLSMLNKKAQEKGEKVKFIFTSTIAVYGLPNLETKKSSLRVKEADFNSPITMYGINKLYCELLGKYYSENYKLLSSGKRLIDFRCVRFPGIISALTTPVGGTSDYAPEMIHSAAKGEGYESFVREDTHIPFMVMPDAVKSLLQIASTPRKNLSRSVYNVTGFASTAGEIAQLVNKVFPDSAISYKPDPNRQKIVDSWPADLDDSKARADWGWQPDYDVGRAFNDYLIPEIKNKYSIKSSS